jgi:hypothetical protein
MEKKFNEVLLRIDVTRTGFGTVKLSGVDPETSALSESILVSCSDEIRNLIDKVETLTTTGI